jgi:polar amino acid transport system substrate-binding protein
MSNTTKILIGALVALVLIIWCAVIGILVWRTFLQPEEAAATPTAPPATATATAEAAVDDSWARVQAAGKMVVGTSADYPPFEYYSGEFELDGFDVALMNEVGGRLGVGIEYVDYAFDGLGNALQLGQLDASIAAISVTAERQAVVDFTSVYLVSEGAVLASDQTQVAISRVEDLAGYRVGVQSGSIYQDWLQTALVDTGLTAPGDLFVYQRLDQAIDGLKNGQIEFVVMDLPTAEAALTQGGFAIAGKGLNQQMYAIALPKGATSLRTEIDRVIFDMQADGTIAQLAKRYLSLAQLPPTPAPAPTSTPAPPPSCVDNLTFVEHPDGGGSPEQPIVVGPGQNFTKVWRVQNSGTCTWDSSYRVVYVDGNDPASSMGGQPTPVEGLVAPDNTYDIQVNLVAPLRPGIYLGIWQMENGGGQGFGQRLQVTIQVPAPATATPAPTPTPAPGITFTVDRTQIKQGECVSFYWKVENVREIYFYKEGQNWQDHGVTGEETRTECPPVSTTYFLRVVNLDGSVEIPSITINVEAVATAPQITRFTVDPAGQITLGQCVTVRWEVKGDVDKVTIAANGAALWEGAPLNGKLDNCPPGTGTVAYSIEAVGTGGTSRQQQNINVVDPATATPEPTPAPEAPVIQAFSVDPNQIQAGECVDVSWSVGGGASYTRILRNGAVVLDNAGFNGQETDCLQDTGGYTYRLEALNPAGESVAEERAVSVLEAAPDNPLADTSWIATTYWDGGQMASVLEGTALTAAFGAGGQLNGSAGCNTYSASYLVQGASLAITPPSLSSMICEEPEGVMEQETAFLNALTSAGGYNLEGGQLFILGASGQAVLEFVQRERE